MMKDELRNNIRRNRRNGIPHKLEEDSQRAMVLNVRIKMQMRMI